MSGATPPAAVAAAAATVEKWLGEQSGARKSDEEVARMSPRERLNYSRSFDQSKMPEWKDPRLSQGSKYWATMIEVFTNLSRSTLSSRQRKT
jgi:hypothetical protein